MRPILCLAMMLAAASGQLGGAAELQCDPEDTVEEEDGFSVLDSGHLKSVSGISYPHGFWHEVDGKHRRCVCSGSNPCFSKCCPHGETISDKICIKLPENKTYLIDVRPDVHDKNDRLNSSLNFDTHFNMIVGNPCVGSDRYILDPETTNDTADLFYLQADGVLWIPEPFNESLSVEKYCFETLLGRKGIYPFLCTVNYDQEDLSQKMQYTIYPIGMIISEPFLLATFLVYALVPKLRSTHGRSLMSHVTSLFTGYLFLAIVQISTDGVWKELCTSSAFIIYFSFLASFFWLNVMCLDIWWTFSGFRPMRGSVKEREHKKFVIYSLYCWGCPLIMLIVAMVMDLHPDIPDTYLKPGFGKRRCWFDEDNATLAYFLGPIAVLIICNILLFVLTAIQIRKLKKDTKILKKQESQRHDDDANNTQRFNLYLKLFLVMGVNWIMEVISWAFGGPEYLWYLTDIGNTLQGVLIFIIFVWKDRIRRLLMEKFCPKRAALNASTKSHGTTLTSTTRASTTRHSPNRNANMSVRSPNDTYRMKPLVASSPSVRSDDSDGP